MMEEEVKSDLDQDSWADAFASVVIVAVFVAACIFWIWSQGQ